METIGLADEAKDELWSIYACCSCVLVLKMMSLTWFTGQVRCAKQVIHSEEDRMWMKSSDVTLCPSGGGHPDVERIRRAHRYDLEIVFPYLLIAPIWLRRKMQVDEELSQGQLIRRCVRRVPERISEVVERFFYGLGLNIAQRPRRWLIGCTVIILMCLSGLYSFHQEKNPLKLWLPSNADFVHDTEWLMSSFGEGIRVQTVIMTGDNVLEPESLIKLNEIAKEVISTQTAAEQISWTDVCYKVPAISGIVHRRKRSSDYFEDDFFDEERISKMNQSFFEPSIHLDSDLYCSIVNSLPKVCLIFSILDIWEYNSEEIRRQSIADIIDNINEVKISPTMGHPMDFTELLGGVTKDEQGRIIAAKAVRSQWMVYVNFSNVDMDKNANNAGTSDWGTEDVLKWEEALLHVLEQSSERVKRESPEHQTLEIWYEAGRSFGDISGTTIFQDIDKLAIGIILMFFYVSIILSHGNWVEWRFCLTAGGLMCIGGAFIIAVGVCSLLRISYGPIHTSLPFMLLGLGVDDIFVMMASWKQVHTKEYIREKPLPERIAHALGHAGSAISITSLTDVVAFIIGASTILPSLQSFCIYAAVGVFVTFLLQITLFVAFFTLDARRINSKRNGMIPCIVHPDFVPTSIDPTRTFSSRLMHNLYSKVVLTTPGKVLILLVTVGAAAAGVVGSLQLEQWFDPTWFLPEESYLYGYIQTRNHYYSTRGYDASVYIGSIDYPTEFPKIALLADGLTNASFIESVLSWPSQFREFTLKYYDKDLTMATLDDGEFENYLSKFLYSRAGGKYQRNFHFEDKLQCGQKTPRILIASIDFTFAKFHNPREWISGMDESKRMTREAGFDGYSMVWCKHFATWVTDKLIAQEVLRNVVLALICVMGTTTVLIAELQTCFWILLCVLLTLLNVCGFMFFWGLTVDIVSCIGLELAIGLSVDYAAHVAHAFLNASSEGGTKGQVRTSRALFAVRHIGAAVAYGAGSTLLALSMMSFSTAYVFRSFFKIFFLVIVFGLWHGLLFLPVVLSAIGPRSLRKYESSQGLAEIDTAENKVTLSLTKETEN
ncbi:hypothetical protein KM043_004199 [Ampulex compressa]|nr:hypothetical protein KM043_004199 [Ampulex compressa]